MKTIDILYLLQPGKSLNNTHRVLLYTCLHWNGQNVKTEKTQLNSAYSRNTLTSSRERHCAGEEMWRPHRSLQSLTTKFPKRIFYPSHHSTLYPYSFLNPLPFTFCSHHCSRVPFSHVSEGFSPTKS